MATRTEPTVERALDDVPARHMSRGEALRHLAALKQRGDPIDFETMARPDGAFGTWPNVRVVLLSPCYGVVIKRPGWRAEGLDPRLAVGTARLCKYLHDEWECTSLLEGDPPGTDGTGGFVAPDRNRWSDVHGRGCAFDLSSFGFRRSFPDVNPGPDGITRLKVDDPLLWPRYPEDSFERPHSSDSPLVLTLAPPEIDLLRSESRTAIRFAEAPILAPPEGPPFAPFILALYRFVQRDFRIDSFDGRTGALDGRLRNDPAIDDGDPPLESFAYFVCPNYQRGMGVPRGGTGRVNHQDHLHLDVPDIDPRLPHPEAGVLWAQLELEGMPLARTAYRLVRGPRLSQPDHTDASGVLRQDVVALDDYTVVVEHSVGQLSGVVASRPARSAPASPVTVQMRRESPQGGVIWAELVDERGPLGGLEYRLRNDESGLESGPYPTDSAGVIRREVASPGQYTLTLEDLRATVTAYPRSAPGSLERVLMRRE